MLGQPRLALVLAASAITLMFSVSAQAGASRTFVATTGNDSNTSANCGATTPCRTFGAALSVTNVAGEVVVVNSGGYGPATITQPVTITANGIVASITQAASGQNGLTINATANGTVVLTGLSISGEGTGQQGILIQNAGGVILDNINVDNFVENGVEVFGGSILIQNSKFSRNAFNGVALDSGKLAYVQNSTFVGNGSGFLLGTGTAAVVDSSAFSNFIGFQVGYQNTPASGGTLDLIRDEAVANDNGIAVNTAMSLMRLYYCVVAESGTSAFEIMSGGAILGTNPGSNVISGTGVGTLGTATSLQ